VVRAHGGPAAVGGLIEFRTSLAEPGRWVTEPEALAVARYRDQDEFLAGLRGHATGADPALEIAQTGAFRATPAGHAFLDALHAHRAAGLAQLWADRPVRALVEALEPVVVAAALDGGPAWHAMAPGSARPARSPELALLDQLSLLRYHRADAHAAVWQAAGRTAAEMAALEAGPERELIEAGTNGRAAPAWAMLDAAHRSRLLQGIAELRN
jgi:hypothetical protein